jgi:hypothetical protein
LVGSGWGIGRRKEACGKRLLPIGVLDMPDVICSI